MTGTVPAAGWFGKLPTVGDFASRRLDSAFVQVWDNWLSTGLARLRTDGDGQWLDAYLASPTWRFMLTPGFLPAPLQTQAWTGVVMPSVDRVGRYFPLTLAIVLPHGPLSHHAQATLWSWLHQLEDLAVDALQEDWVIETLEAELARIGLPQLGAMQHLGIEDPTDQSPPNAFFAACLAPEPGKNRGRCVWFSEADLLAPQLLCSQGLDDSVLQLWKSG
jgi:type VI secretion system protein ImpM